MSTAFDAGRIAGLATELSRPREELEAAFVSVGARLTEGAGLLNTLSKVFEALPEALQGAEVDEALEHLNAVTARATTLSSTFGQEKADLARLVDVVAAASAPIADLRKAVKMMGIVSVNARVTAAGIVGDNEDFDVFTTDIATLSDSANRTIQDFAQVYRQLTTEVDRAATQRARFETSHADTLSGLAKSLAATIEALDRQRISALAGSAETGRVSRQIVGRIGSAVMALQIGDATRQRIEHIEAGLHRMAGLADMDKDRRNAAIGALAHLQHLQLTDSAAAFAEEVEKAGADLNALAQDAGIIMARSRDFSGEDKSSGSAVASLSAQLRAAVTILRDFETERAKLEAVATAVQQTVGVLMGHVGAVQDIEANMRLVSLNAAVRCAQLGPRGASLTVIAMQLRELTTETVVAAEAAMTQLDQSSALAGSFGQTAGGSGSSRVGDLEDQANLALDILTRLDGRIASALQRLNSDGPKVIGLLDGAARELSGQAELAEVLDDMALVIAEIGQNDVPETLPEELETVLANLRKLYTMEAERLIHDRLFPPQAANMNVAQASGEEADLDAFMF